MSLLSADTCLRVAARRVHDVMPRFVGDTFCTGKSEEASFEPYYHKSYIRGHYDPLIFCHWWHSVVVVATNCDSDEMLCKYHQQWSGRTEALNNDVLDQKPTTTASSTPHTWKQSYSSFVCGFVSYLNASGVSVSLFLFHEHTQSSCSL